MFECEAEKAFCYEALSHYIQADSVGICSQHLTHPSPNDWIQSFDDHFYFILFLKRTYFYKFFLVFLFALWHLLPEILNKQLFNSHVAKCNEFFYVAIISTFFDIAQYPHILRNLQVIPLSPTWGRTMPEFD